MHRGELARTSSLSKRPKQLSNVTNHGLTGKHHERGIRYRWKVLQCARSRYSRKDLDLALQREAGYAHTPATLRVHQRELSTARFERRLAQEQ